jgi:hypothetical protein
MRIADEHDHARKSEYPEFESSLLLLARAAAAAPGSREPSRAASRPCGFDPSRQSYGVPRRGHAGKGPAVIEHAGVAITAPVPGALLTGLVAALGPACRLRRRYAHAPAGAISLRRCAPGVRLIGACGPGHMCPLNRPAQIFRRQRTPTKAASDAKAQPSIDCRAALRLLRLSDIASSTPPHTITARKQACAGKRSSDRNRRHLTDRLDRFDRHGVCFVSLGPGALQENFHGDPNCDGPHR